MARDAPKGGAVAVRSVLGIQGLVLVIYGLIFLLIPETQLEMSQDPGAPANPGWVRWAGGYLIGFAIMTWLAAARPAQQQPLLIGLIVAGLLAALALLYSGVSGEYQGVAWVIWLPVVLNVLFSVLDVWLLISYRDTFQGRTSPGNQPG